MFLPCNCNFCCVGSHTKVNKRENMDCAPLNLAHFHERRSERFLRNNRYEEALLELETSMHYLEDAYKNVILPKSKEILETQKWDFERKLRQIEMRKSQHGLTKLRDFVPIKETSPMLPLRPEYSGSAQSVAKAIDKTVQDFDAKFTSTLRGHKLQAKTAPTIVEPQTEAMTKSEPQASQDDNQQTKQDHDKKHDIPSLAPLDLPMFDFTMFSSSSAPSLACFADMAEGLEKS